MHVPTDGWTNGAWNTKLPQFRLLAEMLGLSKSPIAPEDLQDLFFSVANAKAFAENVQAFLDAVGNDKKSAASRVEAIERKLGLTEPLPFMSMQGIAVPEEFDGVAIWPTGVANWTQLRLEQIQTAMASGAKFQRIVCTYSSRVSGLASERRHPLIKGTTAGEEPTEKQVQRMLANKSTLDPSLFSFAELPEKNDQDKPLSLEQQLHHLQASGQYDEHIGGADIYVPSTPNSLFMPLQIRRVLGHNNVWFSQAGARLVTTMPDYWWPSLQDVMTLPNGMIRLWVELLEAGCITK